MRTHRPSRWIVAAGILAAALVVVAAAGIYQQRSNLIRWFERSTLPEAVPYQAAQLPETLPGAAPTSATPQPVKQELAAAPLPTTLAAQVNLAVPFTPQAPHANWDDPYGDFCEEASVLMAMSYIQDEAIPSADFADEQMFAIKDFEDRYFGYNKDTTAAETAAIIREHYGFAQVQLLDNPTAIDIKQAVAAGKPVIVPVAGRLLGNPYFQSPGPLYHMLVIKGYTASGQFITNDPGTRRGADFLYDESVIMNALHDWRSDGQILQGRKVILIVG